MSALTDDLWLALLRRAAEGQREDFNGTPFPPMPDAEIQRNTVGQAGAGAINEAWAFTAECLARFRQTQRFSAERRTLLDFGTGWARIARCFLRDFNATEIIGADIDPDLIAICRQTFPGPSFFVCEPMPPLAITDESMDFITGYSVFSHLSEAACLAWISEFARILKPGGMAALTTRGRWFFDYAASLGGENYSHALSRMFPDFGAAKARYDRGEFVHSNADGVTGGGVRESSFYGETFIPEQYALDVLGSAEMPLVEFFSDNGHPIMFFRKRG